MDPQPIFVPRDPYQALMMQINHLICTIVTGGQCVWPM